MVFRAIDSIRGSVLNSTPIVVESPSEAPMEAASPFKNSSIIPTVELVLGTITYLVSFGSFFVFLLTTANRTETKVGVERTPGRANYRRGLIITSLL